MIRYIFLTILSEMVKGMSIKKAYHITPKDIAKELGSLPEHKIHHLLESKQLKPLNLQHGQTYFAYLYLVLGNTENTGPATTKLAEIIHKLSHQ